MVKIQTFYIIEMVVLDLNYYVFSFNQNVSAGIIFKIQTLF